MLFLACVSFTACCKELLKNLQLKDPLTYLLCAICKFRGSLLIPGFIVWSLDYLGINRSVPNNFGYFNRVEYETDVIRSSSTPSTAIGLSWNLVIRLPYLRY